MKKASVAITLPKGTLCASRCIECVFFNTSHSDGYGSYKCEKRGTWHKGQDLSCSSFQRG